MTTTRATLLLFALACPACDGALVAPGSNDGERRRSASSPGQPLPNWATPSELQLRATAPAPAPVDRAPPGAGFRVPAEYEPQQAILITWTGYTGILSEIAAAAAAGGAEVWAIGGPAQIPGVPASKYKPMALPYNSVWVRDYGPIGIDEATGSLGIIDTTYRHYYSRKQDDAVPCKVAGSTGAKCYTTSLILDGGNVMTDGAGNVFVTSRIDDWNPDLSQAEVDKLLGDYLNAETIHRLDYAKIGSSPADGTGHIDMFAKLLGPCKVLVAQSDQAPFQKPLEAAASYFGSLTCPQDTSGGTYKVFRVPGWASGGTWYTYTNALIVNKKVLMPSYTGADNAQAEAVFTAALPGYDVVSINTDQPITSGGSIHCITMQVPAAAPPANQAPVSSAGADQQAKANGQVTLDGSGSSDPDGDPLTYSWTQTAGPEVTLSDSGAVKPTFTAPQVTQETTMTFSLVVSDGELQGAADTVNVVVEAPAQGWDVTQSAADTPKSIPDSDTTGISSTIAVSAAAGTVAKAEVKVNVTHPYISALRVRLECPDGTMVTLHDYTGGGGKNINRTFPVTACNGQPAAGTFRLWADDRDGYGDNGKLDGWTLSLKLSGGATTWDLQETSADTPKSIPDGDTTGISSTIAVGAAGLVAQAQVEVDITHPYIGALRVRLECPDGTMVTLHDYTGGSGKNINTTYPVTACSGKSAAGDWRLRADDKDGYSDNGQLDGWTLFVKTE